MNIPQVSKGQIKYLQTLKLKKYRQKYGCFVAEGRKVVDEIIRDNHLKINSLYGLSSWIEAHQQLLNDRMIPYFGMESPQLKQVSSFTTPDMVIIECRIPDPQPIKTPRSWLIYLDGLKDPGNLGTILRSADWFGIGDVILSPGSVDCYNAKSVHASMGSLGRLGVHYLEFGTLRSQFPHLPIVLADAAGRPCNELDLQPPGILVIGSESHGISGDIRRFDHHRLAIPKHPESRVESLNAAMATIALLALLNYNNFVRAASSS